MKIYIYKKIKQNKKDEAFSLFYKFKKKKDLKNLT